MLRKHWERCRAESMRTVKAIQIQRRARGMQARKMTDWMKLQVGVASILQRSRRDPAKIPQRSLSDLPSHPFPS